MVLIIYKIIIIKRLTIVPSIDIFNYIYTIKFNNKYNKKLIMAALTQKNGFENELIKSLKERFSQYISSDLFDFSFSEKKEYNDKLAKQLNVGNIIEFSKFRNNLVKQHLDGKISIV